MKKSILVGFLGLLGFTTSAQEAEVKAVKQTITAFAAAGDRQDAVALAAYLDAHYRIVMNRLFGSKTVVTMPREAYLDKIRKKEFGGDKRVLEFKEVLINGTTAMARVNFKGSKMTFHSIIVLVKNEAGKWLLVSDTPVVL